ncbi:TonB-dependent receptor [Yunchengibacter salinarum]|uniref:TonB-dependent receptor n=1 Tax=Yunchengibacter salinarum TaxID=3133399 RepID=UPI0035B6254D
MLAKHSLKLALMSSAAITAGSVGAAAQVEEIQVTATKRVSTTQDVAVAVQALTGTALEDMGISDFDDYMMQLPNVTAGGRGPGQSTIYIRGMATDTFAVQLSGSNGQSPNVALYLDEQPVSQPGRNLDVYVTDIERIEVLPGPQGTLFGASSQAGTMRIITNKPKINTFEAGFDTEVSSTKNGEASHKVEAHVNIPVIEDKLAFRGAFFSDNQGGYIDNVRGTKTLETSPRFAEGGFQGDADLSDVEFLEANNTELVEDDFNDTSYEGFRVGAKWLINDEWDLLVTHMRQKLNSSGVFDYDPEVGDLEVTRFAPDKLEESWNNTAWTLNGKVGMLDVVYTGAFLDRDTDQTIDYTGYADVGQYIPYYICDASVSYPGDAAPAGTCQAPNLSARNQVNVTKQTHELRFTTPAENRFRLTAGVFYDDLELKDRGDFIYNGSVFVRNFAGERTGFPQNAPFPDQTAIDPTERAPGVIFFNDITRTEEQIAGFGEATYEVVPDTLEVTFGARWYDIDVDLVGGANSSFGNLFAGEDVNQFGSNLDNVLEDFRPANESGVIFKGNASWTPTDNTLFYFTWSEGFRPGGMNRGCGNGNETFGFVPCTFETDEVTNWELGWKTSLFENTLQFNGNAFFVEWSDMQTSVFNQNIFFLTFNDNAADSEIMGIEGDFIWTATDNLTLFGAFSILDTEITDVAGSAVNVADEGSELALAPNFQGTLRARYSWFEGDYNYFAQSSLQYSGSSFSSIVVEPNNRFPQDDYAIWNASFGVSKANWKFTAFADNITDTRADLFINTQDADRRIFTNRPATYGFRVSYDY